MKALKARSAGEAWIAYLDYVLAEGRALPDDREEILEAPPVAIEIASVDQADPIIIRDAQREIVELYTQKMFSRDIIPALNSTYGARLFDWNGVDQVKQAEDRLRARWWTKSAVIGLVAPQETMPRIPCLISVLPLLRDERLDLHACFRSQNAMNSYGNFYGLKALQQQMAKDLNVETGRLFLFVSSPHLYRSDIDKARGISQRERAA